MVSKNSGQQCTLPRLNAIFLAVVTFTVGYILLSILAHPEHKTLDYHFNSERGLITGLSATYLSMSAAFSVATLLVHIRSGKTSIWAWVILAVGFTFLALDEVVQFHERVGSVIGHNMNSGIFRNWNDVIVIAYGIIALPIIAVIFPSIAQYKTTLKLFCLAFIFYLLHTFIDSTQDPSTVISRILEESAKLFCGAFLALSMFCSFFEALWKADSAD